MEFLQIQMFLEADKRHLQIDIPDMNELVTSLKTRVSQISHHSSDEFGVS